MLVVGMQEILLNEWNTIDQAVHRLDVNADLVSRINDHIYLKFPAQLFNCSAKGTIVMPVNATITVKPTIIYPRV